jgi:hypothetical protein
MQSELIMGHSKWWVLDTCILYHCLCAIWFMLYHYICMIIKFIYQFLDDLRLTRLSSKVLMFSYIILGGKKHYFSYFSVSWTLRSSNKSRIDIVNVFHRKQEFGRWRDERRATRAKVSPMRRATFLATPMLYDVTFRWDLKCKIWSLSQRK